MHADFTSGLGDASSEISFPGDFLRMPFANNELDSALANRRQRLIVARKAVAIGRVEQLDSLGVGLEPQHLDEREHVHRAIAPGRRFLNRERPLVILVERRRKHSLLVQILVGNRHDQVSARLENPEPVAQALARIPQMLETVTAVDEIIGRIRHALQMLGVSVFDRYRFTVVSTDFIKTPRRAEDFVLKCPEFVIVDEAHGCTLAGGVGRGRQQRFDLLRRVAEDDSRHLVLVTATPHSGNDEAFRSLLSLLDSDFADLPSDLDRREREGVRRRLSRHLVQRRRADIRHYLETDTAFPERKDKEATYTFSSDYRKLFDDILAFARDYVTEESGGQRKQRVRYWSALALLRCVSSSPAAAAATLRTRAAVDDAEDEEIDESVGARC